MRLLHVRPEGFGDHHVFDLPDSLKPDDVLVINDTKVIPARLYVYLRGSVKVEVLLHKKGRADMARAGKTRKTVARGRCDRVCAGL